MNHALLLAGGSGTRFWPLSRKLYPKQFLSIIDEDPMIVKTIKRLDSLVEDKHIWVLGNQDQSDCLETIHSFVNQDQILAEPFAKNTAACIGWGAVEVLKKDPDAVMIILPADAWIQNDNLFREDLKEGASIAAASNTIVTLGIKPRTAHTGYGYIKASNTDQFPYDVDSFTEKPDKDTAEKYLNDSKYFWNAGIFIVKASFLLSLFKDFMPDHYKLLMKLEKNSVDKEKLIHLYKQFDSISIDYGIMEKASSATKLIPARFDWNDIGNWSSLAEYLPLDVNNNASNSTVLSLNARNNLVYSKNKKLVALCNVNDLILVETDDAILLLPKNDDQSIKKVYEQLGKDFK
tara:strand:+ start:5734 stop:6777 length:1044 start_codon:yes stop_codon:yes gene_type:complete